MTSQRDAIRMDEHELNRHLDENFLGVLGTVGPDGAAHLLTVGYLREGQTLLVTSFAAAQKVKNIERSGQASLLVEVPSPYEKIRGAMVRGRATIVNDTDRILDVATRIYEKSAVDGETQDIPQARIAPKRRLIVIEMDRVITWDHRKLSGRY
jgi:PPOX class probable F420-dependent enzyme